MPRPLLLLAALVIAPPDAPAHYHMLLPDRPAVKAGETVNVTYQFGHPFESQLFDAEKPARAAAFGPDGKAADLLATLEPVKLAGPDGKVVVGYRFPFTPGGRGDHTLVFESPPIWLDDEKHFIRDVARVVIHVQAQAGWDARQSDAKAFALVPMTRPYGLRPGTVFQARAGTADAGTHLVELERYNLAPPPALPPDEQITLTMKTDERGVATCTLPDPGWWALTAIRQYSPKAERPTLVRDGKAYPVVERATLWVFVDQAPARKAGE